MNFRAAQPVKALVHQHHHELNVAVESGTFKGAATRILSSIFRTVHTVELSEKLYKENRSWVKDFPNVYAIWGDSAEVIPELAASINQPALWFLDAHWTPFYPDASREQPFPLWAELEALSKREFADLILVDDVHAMGRSGWGPSPPEGVVENWMNTCQQSILASLGERVRRSVIESDMVVCFMNGGE